MAFDPNYNDVSLLLHCNGSNGSTTFTDNSPSPKTVTANGNAQVGTAQSKFGGASALFDGTGDGLSIASNAAFAFGTGDFTIELWLRLNADAASGGSTILDTRTGLTGTPMSFYVKNSGSGNFLGVYTSFGATQAMEWDGALSNDTWYFISLQRTSGSWACYIDGTARSFTTSDATAADGNLGSSSQPLHVGFAADGSSNSINAYIDDLRITKGVARYSANFTPPAEAFANNATLPPTQGTLTITGHMPSLALGLTATPTQGALTFIGQTPKHSGITFLGTPVQGSLAVSAQAPSLALGFAATPGQRALSISGQQPSIATGFAIAAAQGSLTVSGLVPKHSSNTFMGTPGQGALTVTGLQPAAAFGFAAAPTIRQLTVTGLTPGFANRLLHPIGNHWISTHYLCVLTGAADSLTDLPLLISSFQTRMGADPFRVYLSVILPNADAYIAAINARPNGRLKVTRVYNYLDGSFQAFTMAEAPIDSISTNQGGKSGTTGTLTGYETLVAATAQSVTLYDPITRSSSAGGRRYRCRIDPRLRPLDTAVINGESFVVDGVIHIIDTQTAIMEISEKL